ncbi:MAG: DegT/DnrJ/EryC1/StrS family aminotransferase, partial [Terracidiphilus sp.]
ELYERVKRFARLGFLDGASRGMNFKIPAFTAAVGLARLERLNDVLARKRAIRESLVAALAAMGFVEMEHVGEPNGYNTAIDVKEAAGITDFHEALAQAGIKSDVVHYGYKCGYRHRLFAGGQWHCPNAERLVQRLVQLPSDVEDPSQTAHSFAGAMLSLRQATTLSGRA